MVDESVFWCGGKCQKKYTLDKTCLTVVSKPALQAKVPFIDYEQDGKKFESKLIEQQVIYKCPICGFTLKEQKEEIVYE